MQVIAEPMNARHRPAEQLERLFAGGWPEFIFHDRDAAKYNDKVRSRCAELELVLCTPGGDLVAAGWAVPIRWNGDPGDLPTGFSDSLARAWDGMQKGISADTLVIMAAQVRADLTGRGLAGRLLSAFRPVAAAAGLARIIAPVRPTLKTRYPLTPIEEFVAWTREDGLPLDPWVRTHVRLGARILGTAPASQVITGTVTEWEDWAGLRLPATGEYVVPGGLSVLHVDIRRDTGRYVEPNIWLQHA